MKKKCLLFLLPVLLCLFLAFPAHAAAPRLVDGADYLANWEEAELCAKLDEISTRQGMDVVIVTIADLGGSDITAYADDFYDYNGYKPDGILLLISDFDREWALSTAGAAIDAFTDAGQDYMADEFVWRLSDGAYYEAFDTYADICDAFITQAKAGNPYDVGTLPKEPFRVGRMALISLGVGLLTALIATGVMRAQLKTVHSQTAASQYMKPGSMKITEAREFYLYRQLHRRKRETQSSGGSSRHVSSSGRSHGGSRGSF